MPFPSLADAGWILFYLPTFAGIILLAQERTGRRGAASVLDGAIAALAMAGVGAAIAFGAIVDATGGSQLAIATNLAYPIGDLALLALVVGAVAVSGWQLSRRWTGLALGLAVFAVSDTIYLLMIANGTYVGGLIDAGWPLASTIMALAVWQPERVSAGRFVRELERLRASRGVRDGRARHARLRPLPPRPSARARALDRLRRRGDRADDAHLPGEPGDAAG